MKRGSKSCVHLGTKFREGHFAHSVDRLLLIRRCTVAARVYALRARITYLTVVLDETAGRPRGNLSTVLR